MKKKRSTAQPYEGGSPFVFVSYSHKDSRYVYPIVEYLTRAGFRIWYDEGISPSSEWNEVIANHMNKSSMCMAFISENAAASHNCRREISYALLKSKPLLSIFLEQTTLTPGMEMQLSANQCLYVDTYASLEKFMQVLAEASVLKPCLGEPNPAIEVRAPSYYDDNSYDESEPAADFSDDWFGSQEYIPPREKPRIYVLIRQATRELIGLDKGYLSVGRTKDGTLSKYAISNNEEISRKHFMITEQKGDYFVEDCASKNGTFLNGTALPPNKPAKLSEGDEIRISKERFIFQLKPSGGDRLA
jgi:hypothetical protein